MNHRRIQAVGDDRQVRWHRFGKGQNLMASRSNTSNEDSHGSRVLYDLCIETGVMRLRARFRLIIERLRGKTPTLDLALNRIERFN
jgi:hypothetical protein